MNRIIITLCFSLALFLLAIFPHAFSSNWGFLADGFGNPVRDGSGKCIWSEGGDLLPGCIDGPLQVFVEKPQPPVKHNPPTPAKPKPVASVTRVQQKNKAEKKTPRKPESRFVSLELDEAAGSNFASNSAELSINAKFRLQEYVNRIKSSGASLKKIDIVGHTDHVGSEAYNMRLSLQRARSVANYLAVLGLDANIMAVHGRGELQPVASNHTQKGRALNRRVNIKASGTSRLMQRWE